MLVHLGSQARDLSFETIDLGRCRAGERGDRTAEHRDLVPEGIDVPPDQLLDPGLDPAADCDPRVGGNIEVDLGGAGDRGDVVRQAVRRGRVQPTTDRLVDAVERSPLVVVDCIGGVERAP